MIKIEIAASYNNSKDRREKSHNEFFNSFFNLWQICNGYKLDSCGNVHAFPIDAPDGRAREFMTDQVFRYGLELLSTRMPAPDAAINGEIRLLRDEIGIEGQKRDLQRVKETGDVNAVSEKESEITSLIQKTISRYPHPADARSVSEQIEILRQNTPDGLIRKKVLNCLSASKLGAIFMREAGINFLTAIVPGHSFLLLVKTNGQIEWKEMQKPFNNQEMTDEMMSGKKDDGEKITTKCITKFASRPDPRGLMFEINKDIYKKKFWWMREKQRPYISVFEPYYALKMESLYNAGNLMHLQGLNNEAEMAFYLAAQCEPQYPALYSAMGLILHCQGKDDSALESFERAAALDPTCDLTLYHLYKGYKARNKTDKAKAVIEQFRQVTAFSELSLSRLLSN